MSRNMDGMGVKVPDWSCDNVVRGQRCARHGTMSPSTTGTGPWYCHDHMPGIAHGSNVFDREGGLRRLRELTKHAKPVMVLDPEAELERLAIQSEGA